MFCLVLVGVTNEYAALSVDVLYIKIHSGGFNGSEYPMKCGILVKASSD